MTYEAKAKIQQFTRKKSNLLKKAHELAQSCDIDFSLIICKNGRYYTYQSTDHKSWPHCYDSHDKLDAYIFLKPYGGIRSSIGTPGGSALLMKLRIASLPDGL